jgi:hypothetical protein
MTEAVSTKKIGRILKIRPEVCIIEKRGAETAD